MKLCIVFTVIYLLTEYVRIYFAPVLTLEGDTIRDFIDAYLRMTPRQLLSLLAVNLLSIFIVGPLLGNFCDYFLRLTAPEATVASEGLNAMNEQKISPYLLWFTDAKKRSKSIRLRVTILVLRLFWQAVFCGPPLYFLYFLRGPSDSLFYVNRIFILSTALLFGTLLAYVIGGLYAPAFYLMAQDLNSEIIPLIRDSVALMRGHLWEYLAYKVSFVSWYFMVIPTFGILLAYLVPYRGICDATFFRYLDAEASEEAKR